MAEDDRCLLDALQAADRFKGDEVLRCRTTREHVVSRADSRFHDAAGVAEDTAAAGSFAKGLVELAVFEVGEINVFVLDPLSQFTCRNADIRIADFRFIPEEAGCAQFRTADFCFLGRARRDADIDDLLGVDVLLLGKIGLDDRAEDADRTLGRRQMLEQVGVEGFGKFDPGRAAAGELRDRNFFGLQAVQEFRRFFHDGQVGAEIGIEDIVRTERTQGSDHLPFDKGTGVHAKGFAQADADSRSRLEDDDLFRVFQGRLDLVDIVDFDDGTKGAGRRTLAAVNADGHVACTGQGIVVQHSLCVGTSPAT